MAFWYSVRFSRRKVAVRPGLGRAAAARSSAASSAVTKDSYVRSSGRGLPRGGICRAASFRTTFSQTCGWASTSSELMASRASPAFFVIAVVAIGAMLGDELLDGGALKPRFWRRRPGRCLRPTHTDQDSGYEGHQYPATSRNPRSTHESKTPATMASGRKLKGTMHYGHLALSSLRQAKTVVKAILQGIRDDLTAAGKVPRATWPLTSQSALPSAPTDCYAEAGGRSRSNLLSGKTAYKTGVHGSVNREIQHPHSGGLLRLVVRHQVAAGRAPRFAGLHQAHRRADQP